MSEQAAIEYSIAEQDLILQSAQAYFAVLRAQDNLAAVKAEEAAFKRQLDQANERFEVGLSDKTDVLEAQAGFDTARANRSIAQRQVEDAFQALYTPDQPRIPGAGRHPPHLPVLAPVPNEAKAWVDTATRQNLNLLAVNYAVTAAEETLRQRRPAMRQHSTPWPRTAGRQRRARLHEPRFDRRNAALYRRRRAAQHRPAAEHPALQRRLTTSQSREAYYQLSQSEQQRESLRRQVVEATRNLHRAVNTDIEQVQARRQSIISNQSALEATEIGYQVGTRNIVDARHPAAPVCRRARLQQCPLRLHSRQPAPEAGGRHAEPGRPAAAGGLPETRLQPGHDRLPPSATDHRSAGAGGLLSQGLA